MTKEKGMRYGHVADELSRQRAKGELEQVMAGKVLVDMDSIFNDGTFENARDSRPLVILVEGALGSGKTTLAHHYCHEWANGNLTMFDLVALVYLRHPAVHSAGLIMGLDKLLLVASGNDDERDIVGKVAQRVKDGLKFLLILEGWDEAPACLRVPPNPKYPPDNSFLGKLLHSVPSNTTILITSRPDSSVDLQKRPNVKRVEILGFTNESVHDYFREALSTQLSSDEVTVECSKLKEHFSKYPAIESSCYIPLNAAILTLVYLKRNRTLPTTQYELLCELLLCCIDREVNTRQPNRAQESISSLDDLPCDLKEHLDNICKLAYEGIMQNKVVFTQNEISMLLLSGWKWILGFLAPILPAVVIPTQQDLPAMGVLQKVQWAGIHNKTMSYSFSHLSIQELLAAYCISKMKESEQVRVFQTLLGEPRFAAVLQFYAGFTKLTNRGIRGIITAGRDYTKHSLLSYMRCFFEAQVTDMSLYQQVVARMNGQLNLSDVTLSPLDCMSVGYFLGFALRHCELKVDLSFCSLNDHLLVLLVGELSKYMYAEAKAALHGVTELKIRYNKFGIACDIITTVLQTNTTIRTLDISYCGISHEGVESLVRALASLQKLYISSNKIGDNGIAHIATALKTNTTMRTLDIRNCGLSDEGAESLARALAVNRSLQKLDISNNEIGDNGITHIATVFQTNTTLRTLDISHCSISDEGAVLLARALAVNRSLQVLNINYNKIGDNGVAHIATALQTNCTLKKLNVSVTEEAGVESLATALISNNSLEILELRWSSTHPDITMEKMGVCISTNSVLRVLQLAINKKQLGVAEYQQLIEVGGKKLIQSLENNSLRTLVLILDCSYVDEICQALKAAAATVNSARNLNRKGLLDIDQLNVEVESMFVSFPVYYY